MAGGNAYIVGNTGTSHIEVVKLGVDKISAWMNTNVVTTSKDTSATEAAKLMDAHDIGTLVVVEDKKPVGVFTERDVLRQIVAMDKDPSEVKVGDIMTSQVITVDEDSDVAQVSRQMTLHHVKRLPVVNDSGQLVGIITSTDMLKIMAEKFVFGK